MVKISWFMSLVITWRTTTKSIFSTIFTPNFRRIEYREPPFGQNHRQFPVFYYNDMCLKGQRGTNKGKGGTSLFSMTGKHKFFQCLR